MTDTMHGSELLARARTWEEDPAHRGSDAAGLVALLCDELTATSRLAAHLASEVLGTVGQCSIASVTDRCEEQAVAVRWEDGFADEVCELHAEAARERGAIVIEARRHDGNPR